MSNINSLNKRLKNASNIEGYDVLLGLYPEVVPSAPHGTDLNKKADELIEKYGK